MLLGLRSLGKAFLIRTLLAVVLISVMTDGLLYWLQNFCLTDNSILNALYAGVFFGGGIGLIFHAGGSSGGWSILACMIADKAHIGIGQAAVILDATIVLITAAVFQEYEVALLGGITVFVAGQLIDKILAQQAGTRLVHINSTHSKELQAVIDTQFGICGTVIADNTGSEKRSKGLLYLSIDRRHLKSLLQMIEKQAPDAHVTVSETVDVQGQH